MTTLRRYQSLIAIVLCAVLVLLATLQPAQAAPTAQQESLFPTLELSASKTIKITDSGFDPATLSLFGPTDVTWINNTNTTHLLRSGDAPAATGKIFLPLIQRGSPAAVAAASVYLDYLNQEVQADSFSATLAPGESFTYHFTTPGAVKFYLESNPAIQGTVTLSGVGLMRASPSNGEGDVAVTRETILEFSGALAPASVTNAAFTARAGSTTLDYRLNLSADKTRVTLFYKEPLPGSTRVRVSVDGNKLKDAQGNAVDIDGDGVAGGNSTIEFDTLSLTVLPDTVVCGRVFASELAVTASNVSVNTPLKDVTVSVDGTELKTKTDVNGNFCLNPAPVGRFFVHVDGHSATNNIPAGQYYPMVGKAWQSTAGKQTSVGDIFLPLIPANTLQPVSQSSDTQITFVDSVLQQHPDLKGVSIKVPANSLFNDDGERGGKVGIAPVPPDRLPGKLPEGLNFPVVITVQTDGAMNFDKPAPVCFPNLPDPTTGKTLAAGEKSALWSFDHDKGEWAIVGPMTVSADGLMVCSDAGVGIRAPGWHGSFPGSRIEFDPGEPPRVIGECPELGSSDLWDISRTAFDCFSNMTRTLQALSKILSIYDRIQNIKEQVEVLKRGYGDGSLTREEVRAAVLTLKEPKDFLVETYEAFAGANPISKAIDVADCAKNIAEQVINKACKVAQCKSSIGEKICSVVEPLIAVADVLVTTLKRVDEMILSGPIVVFCAVFDTLVAAVEQPLSASNLNAENQLDADLLKALEDVISASSTFQQTIQPAIDAYHQAQELTDLMNSTRQDLTTLIASDGNFSNAYYLLNAGTAIQRGRTNQSGQIEVQIASNTPYELKILSKANQSIAIVEGLSPSVGATVTVRKFQIDFTDNEPDEDKDGLNNFSEEIIGTRSNVADTDADGIPDGVEVQNGTDPLDGLPAQTGILGTADTPGTALDVCVQNDLAVVADGAMGVAIFNVFDSRNPTLVAQIDTPGTAQRVACGEGKAAVADHDKGLAIIDMRSVVTATVAFQLDLGSPTTAVAVAGNVAYAGTQNGRLVAVDLATGAILQETSLAVRINDLSLSSDLLYALTDNNTLHTLDPRFELQLLNSVATPSTMGNSQRLFAGSDLLYTTHGRGYDTFSLSVPTQPTLIAAGSTSQFGWRQSVSNGSKAGLAITGVNSNTPRDLSLYDVSDPSKTDQFQTQFTTPGDATSVVLYKGLAYVADGASGLQIVNYLSYDTLGIAPTISVTTTFNGNKAEENSLARVTALVNDDVQVRQVEFYIDGALVATDGSYPFEVRFVTPRMANQATFKLRVRVVDTGGNTAWSTEQTLTLVPDATAPRVLSYIPATTSNAANSVKRVGVTFNEAIKQSTLTAQSFKLLSSGADNLLGTNDDVTVTGGTLAYDAGNKIATLTFANPLPSGVYRIAVARAVTDLAGNPLATSFNHDFGIGAMIPIGEIVKGTISTQGEQDIYNFIVAPGQEVYFDDQGSSSNYNFFWHLYDPNGKELFNRYLIDNDAGALVLSLGGQYQLQVNASANITGTYQFQLRSVPPDSFNIKIGDTISAGKPGVGSGNIEQPGNKDVYTFQATEGQEVYFDDRGSSSNYNIYWQLYDPNGKQVFSRWLLDNDAGALILNAGSYKIVAGANANIAGTYQFQIRSVPPDQFTIEIGDTVSNGVPGSGAGNIEQPGNKDVYTFQATQGQEVYFDDRGSSSNYNIYWQLYDPSGKQVFSRWLIDSDAGALVLTAGTYKIVVGASANVAGSYQFQIRSTPPEQFAIKIGDTVSNGIPGTGAGSIEQPGNKDIYTFQVAKSQEVYFDDRGSSSNYNIYWQLYDPSGKQLFSRWLIDNDAGSLVLDAGTYKIVVGANANVAGSYQFQIRSTPPDQFPINIGDTVSNGVPRAGVGNLEQPGNKDIYTFQATQGQEVYFDDRGSSSNYNIYWQLYDSSNKQIFSRWLIDNDAGALLLNSGTYTIVVGANANIAGTYQFQIRSVPPDQFNLNIGDTVSNGIPSAGAGNIEQPGNKDIYTFQANGGRSVYFDDQGASSNSSIYWRLYDPKGTQLFSYWLNSNDPGARTLALTGTYTIAVAASANVAGTYQFQIRDATALEAANAVTAADSEDLVAAEIARRREEEEATPNEQRIYLPLVNR